VDDHPLVREWLTNLIDEQPDMKVCGAAGNNRAALGLVEKFSPQIVIVDISMEGGSGLELIKTVKALHPKVHFIILSMHDEKLYAERAMRAGADGYIMKNEATHKVLAAIRTVLLGGVSFSSAVNARLAKIIAKGTSQPPDAIATLSDRELEIFQLLGRGCNTRQASDRLGLGFKTIHGYCARIREKLNLANLDELTFHAIRWHEGQLPR
jgi:two-component system, NarL family, response regulator FusR